MLLNERLKVAPFRIPVHLAIGHEAIAVAADHALEDGDQLALTHRNVAFHLARAKTLEPVVAEYEGRPDGLCGGGLGSMNLIHPRRGVVYTSSILANNLPVACGLAWAHKLRGSGSVVFVSTGDGAMEEGAFFETLVFARSHGLPLVILVENNDHSLASTIGERRSEIHLSGLCGSVSVSYARLSGNRADRYAAELRNARAEAAGGLPVCVEVMVTTQCNHAGPTPGWATDWKSIDIGKGLVIEHSERDPAWVSRQVMGESVYEDFAASLEGHHDATPSSAEARCLAI
jgi:TPP-dependent pyruvate/acetoin dehydrogenase alpha subunit